MSHRPPLCTTSWAALLAGLLFSFALSSLAHGQSGLQSIADRVKSMRRDGGASASSATPAKTHPTYQKMLTGMAHIQMATAEGVSFGTGWVIDVDQRLLVTNHHVIEGYLSVEVYFPETVKGNLNTDFDASLRPDRMHTGHVIDSDQSLDLALVQVDGPLPASTTALPLAARSGTPGEAVHSIAGRQVGSQSLWTYSSGHVRQIVRGEMANGYEAMLLESDMATNQGNSGGPVCNDAGEVVGVVEGHCTDVRLVSIYIDLHSLLEYLGDAIRCVDPATVEDKLYAGQRNLDEGRSETALKLATAALAIEPNSCEALTLRGWCWNYVGDTASALADFEDAIEINPHHAVALQGAGNMQVALGDFDAAIDYLTDAIRAEPSEAGHRLRRGDAYYHSEEFDLAIADYRRVLNDMPHWEEAIHSLSLSLIRNEEFEEGIEQLGRVIGSYSHDADTFFFGGAAMYKLGQLEDAQPVLEACLRLDPQHAMATGLLAMLHGDAGRFDEALVYSRVLVKLLPDDAEALAIHGAVLVQLGLVDEGLSFFHRSLEIEPGNDDLRAKVRKLSQTSGPGNGHTLTGQPAAATSETVRPRDWQPVGDLAPEAVAGRYVADLTDGSYRTRLKLHLRADRRFHLDVTVIDGEGKQDQQTVDGAYQIKNGEFWFWNDPNPSQPKRRIVRSRGSSLLVEFVEFDTWLAFHR